MTIRKRTTLVRARRATLNRTGPKRETYPHTRTDKARSAIDAMSAFCDFDPEDAHFDWTRPILLVHAEHHEAHGVAPNSIRRHFRIEKTEKGFDLVAAHAGTTTHPFPGEARYASNESHPGWTIDLPHVPILAAALAWEMRIIEAGRDPIDPAPQDYDVDPIITAACRHHGVDRAEIIEAIRPRAQMRWGFGRSWRADMPRDYTAPLRELAKAPDLHMIGDCRTGVIRVTDVKLTENALYRVRGGKVTVHLHRTTVPHAMLSGAIGRPMREAVDHPYLADLDLVTVQARHIARSTVFEFAPPKREEQTTG